jgi:hypothetical protein
MAIPLPVRLIKLAVFVLTIAFANAFTTNPLFVSTTTSGEIEKIQLESYFDDRLAFFSLCRRQPLIMQTATAKIKL